MSAGVCGPVDVKRFVDTFPIWHPTVQEMYADLLEMYTRGNVMYDEGGPATKYNLRYATHPMTNLSEANAADYLVRTLDSSYTIEMVVDIPNQVKGHDLFIKRGGEQTLTASVKLASIDPDVAKRSFTVSRYVKAEIKNDASDIILLVDNINRSVIVADMELTKDVMRGSFTSNNSDRIMVFYDKFGGKHEDIVKMLEPLTK
jgi:hypothetical protein